MYVPEFWCGVIATIVFELILIIVYAINQNYKKRVKDEKN